MTEVRDLDHHGVKWMGDLPVAWSAHPVKRHFDIQLGTMLQNQASSPEDRSVPYLKALHVQWGRVATDDLPEMWASARDIRHYGVRPGDLLVCEGGEVGRAAIVDVPPPNCIIQNALHRVRARESADVRFLQYVLHAVSSAGWFDVLCNRATIAHFTGEKLAELRFPLPLLDEQRAIAARLDHETARIDALIEKKQRQIDLLQEKRAAMIEHAVTKGLAPKAKMKDSGIKWLGQIPVHWCSSRLTHLFKEVCHPVRVEPNATYREIGIRSHGRGIFHKDPLLGELLGEKSIFSVEPGFLVFNIVFAWEGAIAVTSESDRGMVASHRFPMFAPIQGRAVARYFCYFFFGTPAGLALLDWMSPGAAGRNRTLDRFALFKEQVAVPPVVEQASIVEFLDHEISRLDALVEKVNISIERLREYRTSLISAAVTGKLNVREEVAA